MFIENAVPGASVVRRLAVVNFRARIVKKRDRVVFDRLTGKYGFSILSILRLSG